MAQQAGKRYVQLPNTVKMAQRRIEALCHFLLKDFLSGVPKDIPALLSTVLCPLPQEHAVLEPDGKAAGVLQPAEIGPDRAAHQGILLEIHRQAVLSEQPT